MAATTRIRLLTAWVMMTTIAPARLIPLGLVLRLSGRSPVLSVRSTPSCIHSLEPSEPGAGPEAADGPFPVSAVAVAPTSPFPSIYVGTWGNGIYQTRDRGVTWKTVDGGTSQVTSFAVYPNDPTSIIAGTANLGVIRITEDGAVFTNLSEGLPSPEVLSVAVGPPPRTTLYAGTVQGLYRSVNNGDTWTLVGLGADEVNSIAIDRFDGEVLYAGTALHGIWVSRNGGACWNRLRFDGPVDALLLQPSSDHILYAGTDGGGVARLDLRNWPGAALVARAGGTTQGAETACRLVNPSADHQISSPNIVSRGAAGPYGGTVIDLKMDPATPTTLYAASYMGVFKTTDNGETWRITGLSSKTVYSLAIDPVNSQNVYAGTRGEGFFRSADGGATWKASEAPLMEGIVTYTLAIDPVNPQIIYAGGRAIHVDGTTTGDWGGGVLKSLDGGTTWSAMDNGLPEGWVYSVVIDPTNPGTLYAGTHSMGVFKSLDGGATWRRKNAGLLREDDSAMENLKIRSLAIDPQNSRNLTVGVWGGGGVFETGNGAESWRIAGQEGLYARVRTVAYNPAIPDLVYAGKASGGVVHLGDRGSDEHWWPFPNQPQGGWGSLSMVTAIQVSPVDGRTIFLGVYGTGVLRSTDGGLTWKVVNNGLSATSVTALVSAPSCPSTIYASTNGSGVFRSTDGGLSWSVLTWTGPWDWASDIALEPSDPGLLYVATAENGIVPLPFPSLYPYLCEPTLPGDVP